MVIGGAGGGIEGRIPAAAADAGRRAAEFTSSMNSAITEAKTADAVERSRTALDAIASQSGRQGELFGASDGIAFETDAESCTARS